MTGSHTSFYEWKKQKYDAVTKKCIEGAVKNLLNQETDANKPCLLLGKIQSGKTRTFIGITALAFDKGYDIAIILTKSSTPLTEQTCKRLNDEFRKFVDEKEITIYDIKVAPENLKRYVSEQKLIFVVKKETNNLDKIIKLFDNHSEFENKKILVIDDEADYASVGFKRSGGKIRISTIPKKINRLNRKAAKVSFIQVTATPYVLYLQPEEIESPDNDTYFFKPNLTTLVHPHSKYIGSEYYFEDSEDTNSPAYHLHIPISEDELEIFRNSNKNYGKNILTAPELASFRHAMVNFLVAGSIRSIQESKKYKCSCIIHTEIQKDKHEWQCNITREFLKQFQLLKRSDRKKFEQIIRNSYAQFENSVGRKHLPSFNDVINFVIESLTQEYIDVKAINSRRQQEIDTLLDDTGQLKLEHPFNIFIGGQMLDRGITVENLICFFYGRNPQTFSQDTVSQHSRMYGARKEKDLRVTRFYTSDRIYNAMKEMHERDEILWEGLQAGANKSNHDPKQIITFLAQNKSGQISYCSPSKTIMSDIRTIKAGKRFLPVGMQTVSESEMRPIRESIQQTLLQYGNSKNLQQPFDLPYLDAAKILSEIEKSYVYSETYENLAFEERMKLVPIVMDELCRRQKTGEKSRKIKCLIKLDRSITRIRKVDMRFSNAPDDSDDTKQARKIAKTLPALILLQQRGSVKDGWKGAKFWWPVLVCPEQVKPTIFSLNLPKNSLSS